MAVYKRGGVYWYSFVYGGERVQESTKQGSKRVAEQMQAAHRTSLAKGEVGIRDQAIRVGLLRYVLQFGQEALDAARAMPRLEVRGLMTMAPVSERAEDSRPVFRRLRELRDAARSRGYLLALDLSMGMSQDFEVAVEEGATHVRVGTILYTG